MDILSKMEEFSTPQEWWEKNKDLLKENIIKNMETSSEKETLTELLKLIDKMKIRNRGNLS